jgi:hypothetical protein
MASAHARGDGPLIFTGSKIGLSSRPAWRSRPSTARSSRPRARGGTIPVVFNRSCLVFLAPTRAGRNQFVIPDRRRRTARAHARGGRTSRQVSLAPTTGHLIGSPLSRRRVWRGRFTDSRSELSSKSPLRDLSYYGGWTVCRCHGARGGAPEGEGNGRYKHGGFTKAAMAERRALSKLIREARASIARLA